MSGFGRARRFAKFLSVSLAFVMAVGMSPLWAYAAQGDGDADAAGTAGVSDAVGAAGDANATSALIAQSEACGECVPGQALVVYHASGAAKGSTGELAIQSESNPLAEAGFGNITEELDLSAADSSQSAASAVADGALEVQSESGGTIASGSDVRVAVVERDDMSVADLVSALESLDFVECAQPNYNFELYSLTDDTYSDLQWALSGEGSEVAGSTSGVGYASASALEGGAASNVVAILDTGVDYTNPDLAKRMWTDPGNIGLGPEGSHGYDGYNLDYDPMPSALGEHGTHCAGIVAAQSRNGEGVASVAGSGSTQIMALRASDDASLTIPSLAVLTNYQYLIKAKLAGVNIVAVNNSWGSTWSLYLPVLDYAINQAGKAGVLSCFAAGNNGTDTASDFKVSGLESPYLIEVASSNSLGELSGFSNYDATQVDIAAPGSNIIATVPNAYTGAFNALLAELSGTKTELNPGGKAQNLTYYTDIAEEYGKTGFSVSLAKFDSATDLVGEKIEDTQGACTCETVPGAIYGQYALKVSVDFSKLPEGYDSNNIVALVSWDVDNPFAAMEGFAASDYALSVTPQAGFANNREYDMAFERLLTSDGVDLLAGGAHAADPAHVTTTRDNYSIHDAHLTCTTDAAKAAGDTLVAQVAVYFSTKETDTSKKPIALTGTKDCMLTGFAIAKATAATDEDSATVPYMIMSGTSMATPMIAGCIAELAALYPNYSPLQLRGLICGGTTPLATTSDQAKIASGGRFTFATATDSAAVSANTWSITTSGTSVTVHGYNLEDAALYIDGSETPVAVTAQSAGAITFTADLSLFDGKAHRYDVKDSSTMRTYNASYVTPELATGSLVRLGNLPTDVDGNTGMLVASSPALFYADAAGEYLYTCMEPGKAGSNWYKLAAPGLPWKKGDSVNNNRSNLSYVCADRYLYAFATDGVANEDGSISTHLYCNIFDMTAGSWSGFKSVATNSVFSYVTAISSTVCGAKVCCTVAGYQAVTQEGVTGMIPAYSLYTCEPGGSTFDSVSLTSHAKDISPGGYFVSVGSKLVNVGLYATVATELGVGLMTADLATGELASDGSFGGLGTTSNVFAALSYIDHVKAAVGNGIVVIGGNELGQGDMQLLNTYTMDATELGSFGLMSSGGLTAASAAMFKGELYINCIDHGSEGTSTPVLCTLPESTANELDDNSLVISLVNNGGGKAQVSSLFGQSEEYIKALPGDAITWMATPDSEHVFAGWYDRSGNLVSKDQEHIQTIANSTTLVARFTAKNVTRLFGDSALDTMADIVSEGSFAHDGTVVLATLDNYPDALSAAGIAGLADAPVLLTSGTELSAQTGKLLSRLRPTKIIVCGGTSAISDSVASAAKSAAGATRLYRCAGTTRSGTACEVYRNARAYTTRSFRSTAFITTGSNFADALAIAPYGYRKHCAIFLTEPDGTISDQTLQTMQDGGISSFYILGGENAVPDAAKTQLEEGGMVFNGRISGNSRYQTSLAIAQFEIKDGQDICGAAIATGKNYKDALTGAAFCGSRGYVLLLADDSDRSAIEGFMADHGSLVTSAYIFGGKAAVSQGTEDFFAGRLG